jgi:hypothetical protein
MRVCTDITFFKYFAPVVNDTILCVGTADIDANSKFVRTGRSFIMFYFFVTSKAAPDLFPMTTDHHQPLFHSLYLPA